MTGTSFRFMTATDIRFGRGVARAALPELAGMATSVLLVHGKNGARADWLHDALQDKGVLVTRFAIPAEPDIDMIEKGLAVARAAQIGAVIAIGGGAAIDAGKALAALVPAHRSMMDHLEVVGAGLPLDVAPLPFAAIPTTAGTGAEVTKNAVLAVPEARRKVSLRDPRMLPNLAVVDPVLMDNLPRSVTLASGLDAVTQVIEPYLSCKANRMSDAICRDAIPLGIKALVTLMEDEDASARDDLAWTSLCGGLALANAGLGAVHGLAGVLGGMTGAPHGAICGRLLPFVLEANHEHLRAQDDKAPALARFREVEEWIGDALGVMGEFACDRLRAWAADQGLPGLTSMGVREEYLPEIAAASEHSSSMKGNPLPLDQDKLQRILSDAM